MLTLPQCSIQLKAENHKTRGVCSPSSRAFRRSLVLTIVTYPAQFRRPLFISVPNMNPADKKGPSHRRKNCDCRLILHIASADALKFPLFLRWFAGSKHHRAPFRRTPQRILCAHTMRHFGCDSSDLELLRITPVLQPNLHCAKQLPMHLPSRTIMFRE